MDQRRVIRVILESRDPQDPRRILQSVADSFGKDDICIEVRAASCHSVHVNEQLEAKALDSAQIKLDKQDAAFQQGQIIPASTKEQANSNQEWRKEIKKAGISAFIQALVKSAFEKLTE